MTLQRVLIVDDDEALRSLLRLTLPGEGLELLEAADGEQALRVARDERPDLVVLDWRLPGRSGVEVLTELRELYPSLPVIVLTAESDPLPRRLATELRADAFLTKPFSPLGLLDLVERLLAERQPDEPA
jgi:DNA-binding response OmpR family regulator